MALQLPMQAVEWSCHAATTIKDATGAVIAEVGGNGRSSDEDIAIAAEIVQRLNPETRDDHLYDAAQRKFAAGEAYTKDEANAYFAAALFNPINQVYFRAGLIACREYMARFVEAQSPEIAASIRANWWPQLGKDYGSPRQMDWNELAEGSPDEGNFRVKTDEISPTLEALPIALQFLQTPVPAPLVCSRTSGVKGDANG